MNKTLIFALLGVYLLGTTAFFLLHKRRANLESASLTEEVIEQWRQFKAQHYKKYADPDMEVYRMEIFAQNLEVVKADTTGTFGITQFFDLSKEEFAAIYLTLKVGDLPEPVESTVSDQEVNDISVNWASWGKVSRVKNQQQCGSCWAFSTTGSIESALIIAGYADQSIDLSEQQLVDCSSSNSGCNGGWMDTAFQYVGGNPLTTENNYPYVAYQQGCNWGAIRGTRYTLNSYVQCGSGDVNGLKNLLQRQPLSVAVDASNWGYYGGGVFNSCGANLNHGVLLVGFENGAWIVKNSWGTGWGEGGYIRLSDGNTCGIANAASFPLVVPPVY